MTRTKPETEKKKRPRKRYTYQHRTNAVHITLYSPSGETVPAEIRQQFEQAATDLALPNKLLINIATT